MEFHHIKPEEKEFQIASAIFRDAPVETVRRELQKCVPLCANDHKIVHARGVHNFHNQYEMTRAEALMAQLDAIKKYRSSR